MTPPTFDQIAEAFREELVALANEHAPRDVTAPWWGVKAALDRIAALEAQVKAADGLAEAVFSDAAFQDGPVLDALAAYRAAAREASK
jgi:hypothetical protein